MNTIFIGVYLMFLIGCFIASIFIIFHITRYSINKKSSNIMTTLFILILLLLLLINFSIFKTLNLNNSLNFIFNFNNAHSSF